MPSGELEQLSVDLDVERRRHPGSPCQHVGEEQQRGDREEADGAG
jgi:hypothetical protein